jgi:hypothetical protein
MSGHLLTVLVAVLVVLAVTQQAAVVALVVVQERQGLLDWVHQVKETMAAQAQLNLVVVVVAHRQLAQTLEQTLERLAVQE